MSDEEDAAMPADTYLCDGGKVLTWAEIVGSVDADCVPCDEDDAELLLWAFDATPLW